MSVTDRVLLSVESTGQSSHHRNRSRQTKAQWRQWHGCCVGDPIRHAHLPWRCTNAPPGNTMTGAPSIGTKCSGCCR